MDTLLGQIILRHINRQLPILMDTLLKDYILFGILKDSYLLILMDILLDKLLFDILIDNYLF
jgi:hypothetical protein